MKNSYILFLLCLVLSSTLHSQHTDQKYWELLLQNKREAALENFTKNTAAKEELTLLLSHKLLRMENGIFAVEKDFIQQLSSFTDFEYYLYAFWNKPFVFSDYLESGFTKETKNRALAIDPSTIQDKTVKEALTYLKSIIARDANDWETYYALQQQMSAIKEWQFCGVFENLNKSGLDIPYPPESIAKSTPQFDTNGNGYVNWYNAPHSNTEGYQFFSNHSEYGHGVNYAQTFISNPNEQKVVLRIGNSGKFKLWLNDVEIYSNNKDVTTDLDAYNVAVNLPKGTNRLLIKNAESNSESYFMVRITDTLCNPITNLSYTTAYKEYNKSSVAQIDPKPLDHSIERFFKNKLAQNPNDFFHRYALILTYLRNSKFEEAKGLITPLQADYPKSSLLRNLLIICYQLEEEYTTVQELRKNMELDDENYYLSILYQFQDQSKLSHMDINELEEFLNKLANATDQYILKESAKILLSLRKSDRETAKKELTSIIKKAKEQQWIKMLTTYGTLYTIIHNDKQKEKELLEYITNNYLSYSTLLKLVKFYNKSGEEDKATALLQNFQNNIPGDNYALIDLIAQLQKHNQYKASLHYIELALQNYPYSSMLFKQKGDALLQLQKKNEALQAYKTALGFNSNNRSLRNKISDLTNEKDIIESYVTNDVYSYIEINRNKNISNNHGFTILLDEAVTLLYPESGGKSKHTYMYEITANAGVENFKEYDLGLTGGYSIVKSEIVKPNGSIVPAERSGSNFVFNGLSVGDVVLISYESYFGGSGRFYRDFVDYYQFDSFHPCLKTKYILIAPQDKKIKYKVTNGELSFTKEQEGDQLIYQWSLDNSSTLSQQEYFMPQDVDIARYLHISTIESWNEIAFWYSDLVRSQMESNPTVEKTFASIFPSGIKNLSKNEIAKRIYYYIMDNFNYSYVSFRQSGYIPQKPSKTISSKLGDCKDFSTLFVTLAEKAGLDANLVLILTSDNGEQSLVLPSQNFNHCIVKVKLDQGDQFLELTDKNLPYKSLPVSLENATALEIPFMTTNNKDTYELFKLNKINKTPSVYKNNVNMMVNTDKQKIEVSSSFEGAITSYYKGVFAEPNYDVVKKTIFENFSNTLGSQIKIDTIYNINKDIKQSNLKFSTAITANEKINKIGKTKIIQIPNISSAYSTHIINEEERKYPIVYNKYENVDRYITEYDIYIEKSQRFTEIPKNQSLSFKKHHYSINYELVNDNHLKVMINAVTDKENILPQEYPEFKSFVSAVLEAKEAFIGYE
ncbi:transglutaminase domain-containing protein [Aquimarina brevivitae]|uniref:Uncharacterized protein DUF3857 n=1 Tax=Aquimarina brevivitae TaxID=323412 RepID=A0A4Q7P2H9_9FLAO|nr:transglutaminase domain-containing protein [Aquimarina brevivitae]RZS93974.1 uncharacterized protein DUF3857 [Aquimarina brevivitae]